jgi:Ribonuclease G/E
MEEVELKETLTGLAIREFLLQVREGSPNDFYRIFRKVKPTTSYDSVRRYFYILRHLGLIEPTRKEKGRGPIPKQLYRIVPGMEGAVEWSAPQVAMYPATRWGKVRYEKAKRRGLV